MKQHNKETQLELSHKIENAKDEMQQEPIEYFINSQSFGFRFCYMESQDPNYAENLVDELNNKEEQ